MVDLYVGVLSGTSLDSIDVGVFSFENKHIHLHNTYTHPIPPQVKQQCIELSSSGQCTLSSLGKLDVLLGELFATAINECLTLHNISPKHIRAIGSHGQTIWHEPSPKLGFTMQIGDANVIAERTSISVVSDFRRRNMAAGGQGAPLAPAFHQEFFQGKTARAIINIGGISNISLLTPDKSSPSLGFDIGPGNCLMDSYCQKFLGKSYDNEGKIAKTGDLSPEYLENLLEDPYFQAEPPKSTGREYFTLDRALSKLLQPLAPESILRTLLELTTSTIANVVNEIARCESFGVEVYICGGGANNEFLIENLKSKTNIPIYTTSELNLDPDWVEAGLFAWLAKQNIERTPTKTANFTGAYADRILGATFQAVDVQQTLADNTSYAENNTYRV